MYTSTRRRRVLHTMIVATAAGGLALFAASPALAQEVSLDPATGVSDGDTVTVTATGLDAIDGQQAAVLQCGNADSDGTPIPASEAQDADSFAANCFGTEALGTPQLVLKLVTDAAITADYPVVTSGIGANDATCIPNAEAELPCQIVVADVADEGDTLTVAGAFDVGSGEGAPEAETEGETPEELPRTGAGIASLVLAGAGLTGTGAIAVGTARLRRRR